MLALCDGALAVRDGALPLGEGVLPIGDHILVILGVFLTALLINRGFLWGTDAVY